jgi:hypothetical protein
MKEKIFNFKDKPKQEEDSSEINIIEEEVKLTNKHIEFIKEIKDTKEIFDFGRGEGEKVLIKNLLDAVEPTIESQSEDVKKSFEYFKTKLFS